LEALVFTGMGFVFTAEWVSSNLEALVFTYDEVR
jgi:hypothetical protein